MSDLPKVGESGMVEYPQVNTFIDTALMLATDAGDLAIINYAIKNLKNQSFLIMERSWPQNDSCIWQRFIHTFYS